MAKEIKTLRQFLLPENKQKDLLKSERNNIRYLFGASCVMFKIELTGWFSFFAELHMSIYKFNIDIQIFLL